VVEADWTHAGGYAAVHRLLAAAPEITAVFVHNDTMAIGALRAPHEHGLRVPADCSLVSRWNLSSAPPPVRRRTGDPTRHSPPSGR
jgi:LacI family transcriptional regulator